METFLKAATQAWNPIHEVRRRLQEQTLTVSDVLAPAVAAIVACNLLRMAAWNFFWNAVFHGLGHDVPELRTNDFVVQFGSAIGVLVPLAALMLLPGTVFRPYGRPAVSAAILLVAAALSFYAAIFSAVGYFVAGAQAWEDPERGMATFSTIGIPMAIAELGLVLYFWSRIGLSLLQLSMGRFVAITLVSMLSLVVLAALIFMAV